MIKRGDLIVSNEIAFCADGAWYVHVIPRAPMLVVDVRMSKQRMGCYVVYTIWNSALCRTRYSQTALQINRHISVVSSL